MSKSSCQDDLSETIYNEEAVDQIKIKCFGTAGIRDLLFSLKLEMIILDKPYKN